MKPIYKDFLIWTIWTLAICLVSVFFLKFCIYSTDNWRSVYQESSFSIDELKWATATLCSYIGMLVLIIITLISVIQYFLRISLLLESIDQSEEKE